MVYTRVASNKSPWLQKAKVGDVYAIPASHGEGRFVASDAWIKKLFETGCVATQYVDVNGNPTMNEDFNANEDHMQQSKVLQARMEGFSEKWHIRNVSEIKLP